MKRKIEEKQYEELTFTDDFMFCKVLENDEELSKELLELILNIRIRKVVCVSRQKPIDITTDGKGVRFDVYVEDEANTIYDIEMQAVFKKDIPKRSRYYQGMIDLNLIEKGAKYSDLKRSFVIFICLSDPFKKNLPVYRFTNRCDEMPELELNDEAYKVFVNAACTTENMSDELKAFFEYLCRGKVQSEFVRRIKSKVDKARKHEEWRLEYMTLFMRDMEKKEEGRQEGLLEGRLEKGMICYLNMLKEGISREMALRIADITEEEALLAEDLRSKGEI